MGILQVLLSHTSRGIPSISTTAAAKVVKSKRPSRVSRDGASQGQPFAGFLYLHGDIPVRSVRNSLTRSRYAEMTMKDKGKEGNGLTSLTAFNRSFALYHPVFTEHLLQLPD